MIEKETFLFQLVELAGGFTERAASDDVNLAYRIDENRTIRIPSVDEISRKQDIEFTEEILAVVVPTNSMNEANDAFASRININTATQTQLESLPGIGPTTATQIIQFRNREGPFKKIEDIMNVPGIKASKFALLKEQITV
jgi:competence protein ComEA